MPTHLENARKMSKYKQCSPFFATNITLKKKTKKPAVNHYE